MKITRNPVRLSLAVAAITLSSCADPYYSDGPSQVTVYQQPPGSYVAVLPSGYETEVIGGVRYYTYGDTYFRPRGSGYVVVEVPSQTGYFVNSLPSGYRTEIIGGERYYTHNGRYYRTRGNGYVVVEAPRQPGSYVKTLPSGYQVEVIGGERYYTYNNRYYRPRGDGYVLVDAPVQAIDDRRPYYATSRNFRRSYR